LTIKQVYNLAIRVKHAIPLSALFPRILYLYLNEAADA